MPPKQTKPHSHAPPKVSFKNNGKSNLNSSRTTTKTSQWTGVHWCKSQKRWISKWRNEEGQQFSGTHLSEDDAVNHRDGEIRLNHLRRMTLNKPTEAETESGWGLYISASEYLGVSWCTIYGRWRYALQVKGKRSFGRCDSEVEAAKAYDRASVRMGLPARNFPTGGNHTEENIPTRTEHEAREALKHWHGGPRSTRSVPPTSVSNLPVDPNINVAKSSKRNPPKDRSGPPPQKRRKNTPKNVSMPVPNLPMPDSEQEGLSEYELLRLENMRRNAEFMGSIGLGSGTSSCPPPPIVSEAMSYRDNGVTAKETPLSWLYEPVNIKNVQCTHIGEGETRCNGIASSKSGKDVLCENCLTLTYHCGLCKADGTTCFEFKQAGRDSKYCPTCAPRCTVKLCDNKTLCGNVTNPQSDNTMCARCYKSSRAMTKSSALPSSMALVSPTTPAVVAPVIQTSNTTTSSMEEASNLLASMFGTPAAGDSL